MSENIVATPVKKSKKGGKLKAIFLFIFFLLFIAVTVWGGWSYKMYLDAKNQITKLSSLDGQQELAKQEIDKVVEKVKKHIRLPEGEDPVMATIIDVESLVKEQPFYQGANNGDKVLVYPKAQKAILYSPLDDIIVNVGPVYLDQAQAGSPAPATSEATPKPTPEPTAEVVAE